MTRKLAILLLKLQQEFVFPQKYCGNFERVGYALTFYSKKSTLLCNLELATV
jgi:hypothetical protein